MKRNFQRGDYAYDKIDLSFKLIEWSGGGGCVGGGSIHFYNSRTVKTEQMVAISTVVTAGDLRTNRRHGPKAGNLERFTRPCSGCREDLELLVSNRRTDRARQVFAATAGTLTRCARIIRLWTCRLSALIYCSTSSLHTIRRPHHLFPSVPLVKSFRTVFYLTGRATGIDCYFSFDFRFLAQSCPAWLCVFLINLVDLVQVLRPVTCHLIPRPASAAHPRPTISIFPSTLHL